MTKTCGKRTARVTRKQGQTLEFGRKGKKNFFDLRWNILRISNRLENPPRQRTVGSVSENPVRAHGTCKNWRKFFLSKTKLPPIFRTRTCPPTSAAVRSLPPQLPPPLGRRPPALPLHSILRFISEAAGWTGGDLEEGVLGAGVAGVAARSCAGQWQGYGSRRHYAALRVPTRRCL